MRYAQAIERPWPVGQDDLPLFHTKIVAKLYAGKRKDKWRAGTQDTEMLEELPTLGRNRSCGWDRAPVL